MHPTAGTGSEAVAASPEFAELQKVHRELVAALRVRSPNTRRIVSAAKVKAMSLTPGLQDFYARITRRADHFAPEPAVDEAAYVGGERT